MSYSIIEVNNLSKSYTISHEGRESYTSLRDVITRKAQKIFSFPKALTSTTSREEFWALKDVSFEIARGDRVGIVGRNGAGKSTLLKILSRITEPTAGEIKIKGRVASLLEVGTGFHPELTGRENIFLNGAILGMSRAEIRKHFDAIVDFAEVERFLDTPVKRYSSGMYVRLAFAVAAHLEPDILIVDEVLSVGDAEFQKKCLGKMEDVSRESGKTILFVSHNLSAIARLCSKGVMLDHGKIAHIGGISSVIREYNNVKGETWEYKSKGSLLNFTKVETLVNGQITKTITSGDELTIRLFYEIVEKSISKELSVSLLIYSNDYLLTNLWTSYFNNNIVVSGNGVIECKVAKWPFREADFNVVLFSKLNGDTQDWIENFISLKGLEKNIYNIDGEINSDARGITFVNHDWNNYST